jgi:hypothetical protein
MQFSFSGSGHPAEVRESIHKQKESAKESLPSEGQACVDNVAWGIARYLDRLERDKVKSAWVSATVNITYTP